MNFFQQQLVLQGIVSQAVEMRYYKTIRGVNNLRIRHAQQNFLIFAVAVCIVIRYLLTRRSVALQCAVGVVL